VIQACLNGDRPGTPATPAEIAADARAAVDAGADALHVHPRDAAGSDSLEPACVAEVVSAIRGSCPGTPLGLTTGLWAADGDPARRLALVAGWTELPDYVSVNVSEPGFASLCSLLHECGIGVEAGVWDVEDACEPAPVPLLRALVEVGDGPGEPARALEISSALPPDVPQLHHGEGATTWAVLETALARGHDIRIGLEDTLVLADGSPARDNAHLVAEALRLV
jgi:uncharacterized protein (DUF849 family)